ncbi:MAG: hypothetical protein SNJ75_16310, partial [Gemmataceae bacterium]
MLVRLFTLGFLSATLLGLAADWPAWRGADRSGLSRETGLLRQWPAGGPKLAWKVGNLGGGYSTPSIAEGKLYVLGARGLKASGGGKGKGKGGGGSG